MKLTKKQEAFVYEYLLTFNATQAYLKAGYKAKNENTAAVAAHKLLRNPKIKKKISQLLEERRKKYAPTVENTIKELTNIAFSDLFNLIEIDEYGNVKLRNITNLSESDRRAIHSLTFDAKTGTIKIKMHDKLKALELLGKHLGMFEGEKPDTEQLNKLQEIIEELKNVIPE